jgi:hypothetical protein
MTTKAELKLHVEYVTKTPFPYVLLAGHFEHPKDGKRTIHVGVTLTGVGQRPLISGLLCEGTVKELRCEDGKQKSRLRPEKSWQARLSVDVATMKKLLASPRSATSENVLVTWNETPVSGDSGSHLPFFGVDPHVEIVGAKAC